LAACSCDAPAGAVHGDLVEEVALATLGLVLVLDAPSLLETLEHLVLARGVAELGVTIGYVGLALLEVTDAEGALRLDVLGEGLVREQLADADGGGSVGGEVLTLLGSNPLEVSVNLAQTVAAAGESRHGSRQLLAG
jgi:hypothetical protein